MRASSAPALPSTRSPPMREGPVLTLAVPCRSDEPGLARPLEAAHAALGGTQAGPVELLVCINGPDRVASAALRDVRAFARGSRTPFAEVAVDGVGPAPLRSEGASCRGRVCAGWGAGGLRRGGGQ